ncbi:MAG: hypothetical protein BIFFINMI_02769 [Phycisphaerae bacterium]|nr:hypothetical protein [Phycisphaerae bacterium]
MQYDYTEWDGSEFVDQQKLMEFFGQVMEFVLQYGQQALDAMERLDPEQAEMLQQLVEQGLLEKVKGRYRLTPKAVSMMERKALMEVFANLSAGTRDAHDTPHAGHGGERTEGSRPYQFGDPVSELDLTATLKNALARNGANCPIQLNESDLELYLSQCKTSVSLAILLDMSGSMARFGRFFQAKKVAMAMHALIRQRFSDDTLDIVGFYSTAEPIDETRLPLLTPKRVTVFDYQVSMRVPLAEADRAPQHFTNLQMGLRLARQALARRGGENKIIFVITDGEPTAHVEGDELVLLYPPDRKTTATTLTEALAVTRAGCRIATFALIDDYYYMDWVGFVDQMTKLTRGVSFYCGSGDLAGCIMESYLSGKKRKTFIS